MKMQVICFPWQQPGNTGTELQKKERLKSKSLNWHPMSDIDFNLRYPIGKAEDQPFHAQPYSEHLKEVLTREVKMLPALFEHSVLNLDEAQLNSPYRPGGWTVQQLVHHVADSHMNAYIRFKLALTEDNPVIKPYDEAAWAELDDSRYVPVNVSFTLLHALHRRWHELMIHIPEEDWKRTVFHPQRQKVMSLWSILALYAWHGKHHLAHVTSLRERMGW
jgi:hypothetical protein